MPFYGVRQGRQTGVLDDWEETQESVLGYSNNEYRRFETYAEAFSYVYDDQDLVFDSDGEEYSDVGDVYVDGACINNQYQYGNIARAGYGVFWGKNNNMNLAENLPGKKQTNIRAEIVAVTTAIHQAVDATNHDLLRIFTDSNYFLECYYNHMPKWLQNGWLKTNGQPVVNRGDWMELRHAMNRARKDGITVEFIHVYAHSGVYGNEMADKLAKEGANKH